MTGSPTELIYLARALHKEGFDVHCPVLPGHLQGRIEVMRPSWQDWMQLARSEYETLETKYKSISVGGVCVGAVLALGLAEEKQPKAVISLAPILTLNGWSIPW